jgi:phosphomannomutase
MFTSVHVSVGEVALLHNFRAPDSGAHRHVLRRALSIFSNGESIALAHDTRSASADLVNELLRVLPAPEIINLGLVTTPAAAVWARQRECPRLAVVTSSHTGGPDWLGLKLYRDGGIPIPVDEERSIRLAGTTTDAHDSARKSAPRVRPGHNEVVASYREAVLPYLTNLSGVTVHVLPQWIPFFVEIGLGDAVGDGFADPKGESPPALPGVHIYLDGDADQLVALVDGRQVPAQKILRAWLTQSAGPCVVSADCHPDIVRALKRAGQRVFVTPVGDQFVVEEMIRRGSSYGGEPNGHLIDASMSWSPDALRAASFLSTSADLVAGDSTWDLSHERYRVARSAWSGGPGEKGFVPVEHLGVWIQDIHGSRVMARESIYEDSVIIDVFGQLSRDELTDRLGTDFNEAGRHIA